jgi:hypothetical protein
VTAARSQALTAPVLYPQEFAAAASAFGGNPIEYGNIDVVEPARQTRHRAAGLRYHDLRTCDHHGERFDHRVVNASVQWRRVIPAEKSLWRAAPSALLYLFVGSRSDAGPCDPLGS